MCKYLCYLTISLNDQLHITPTSAAINQSESAKVALSYLDPPPPRNSQVPACIGRVTTEEPGSLVMMEWPLVIRACLYETHSQQRKSNKRLKGTVKQESGLSFFLMHCAIFASELLMSDFQNINESS